MAKKKVAKASSQAETTPVSPSDIAAYGAPIVNDQAAMLDEAGDALTATVKPSGPPKVTADHEEALALLDLLKRSVQTAVRLDAKRSLFIVLVPAAGEASVERFERIDDMLVRLRGLYGTDTQAIPFDGRRLVITDYPSSYLIDDLTSYPLFPGADQVRQAGEGYMGPPTVTPTE